MLPNATQKVLYQKRYETTSSDAALTKRWFIAPRADEKVTTLTVYHAAIAVGTVEKASCGLVTPLQETTTGLTRLRDGFVDRHCE